MEENSGDPDKTPHSMASDLSLHCLVFVPQKDARLKWAK